MLSPFNESDARKQYGIFGHHLNEWTEIRVLDPSTKQILINKWVKGERDFIETIRPYWDKTVWAGLNPRKTNGGSTNEDVARRTAILIDIDYHHKEQPATDEEIEASLEKAKIITTKLVAEGHPRPWTDVSGNGVHMILMVDLPAEEAPRERVLNFYHSLGITIDEKNADLARMCRVTGTYNADAKRLSYLIDMGDYQNDTVLMTYLRTAATKINGQPNLTVKTNDVNDAPDAEAAKHIKKFLGKCRPCIRAMINGTNDPAKGGSGDLDHEAHLCIVKEAQYNGLGYREICALFLQQADYKKDLTEKYVKAAIEDNALKGITPWYCNNLIKRGWCIALDSELCLAARWDPSERKLPKEEPKDKATELINIAHENAVEFFRDQYKTPYAVVKTIIRNVVSNVGNDGNFQKSVKSSHSLVSDIVLKTTDVTDVTDVTQTVALCSRAFKWWLARLYHEKTGAAVGKDYINSATLVLEAETQTQPIRYLYNRFAPNGELCYWWDMADDKGRAVHIDATGWDIRPAPHIFIRHDHMMPLPEPVKTRDLSPLLDYLNLEETGDKLLAVVGNISRLISEVPRIGSVSTGMGGSGKSTWDLLTLYTLDPSSTDLLTIPSKDEDLIQLLEHHAVAIFDNVGSITKAQSDIFCRAITGSGNEKRELYTTDESHIRQFMHILGFNGVSMPIEKGDLFSRVILLAFGLIDEDQRKTFAEMKTLIKKDVPQIIGAMLTVLVDAINIYPTVKSRLNVRMSDFVRWGCAITMALGLRQEDFETAYRDNLLGQDEEAVHASMVAEEIIRYMKVLSLDHLEGSASELKKMIEDFENPTNEYGKPSGDLLSRREGWPKNHVRFGRELSEVAVNLLSMGYHVVTPKRGRGKSRNYTISKVVTKKDGPEAKGQRRFETVDAEELTETRLMVALAGRAKINV